MMQEGFAMNAPSTNDELDVVLRGLSYQEIFHQFNTVNDYRPGMMANECPLALYESHNQTENNNLKENGSSQTKKESQTTTSDKRKRTLFSPFQLSRMEEEFRQNMYVVGLKRWRLATELCLSEKQVKIWFQNRRMKLKREQVKSRCLNSGFPWY